MSRIFVTGDTHRTHDIAKIEPSLFLEQLSLTKNDYMIICGDVGILWSSYTKYSPNAISEDDKSAIQYWQDKYFTTLFIDGNHECLHKDTDILTEYGWMNIEEIYNSTKDIKIANFDSTTHKLYYNYPTQKIKKYQKEMIEFLGKNVGQCVSFNHDVILNETQKIKAIDLIESNLKERVFNYTINTVEELNPVKINNDYLELIVAFIMDGTLVDYKKYNQKSNKARIQFHLKRTEKIDYICDLLQRNNIPYTKRFYDKDNSIFINIYSTYARNICDKINGIKTFPNWFMNLNKNQFEIILKAIRHTDGTFRKTNEELIWFTTDYNNYNIISILCAKFGYNLKMTIRENQSGYTKNNSKTQYHCSIKQQKRLQNKMNIQKINYNDYSYCVTMPLGNLIIRYKERITLTGNCHTALNSYPIEEWNGGKIHRLSDSVIHLMRGQVYTIDGKKFFTMGGADSIDKGIRTPNVSWWEEEMPSQAEYQEAMDNLEKNDFKVDYVITHDCGTQIKSRIVTVHNQYDELNQFLWHLEKTFNLQFEHWYFGHHHIDRDIDEKHTCLYNTIREIKSI